MFCADISTTTPGSPPSLFTTCPCTLLTPCQEEGRRLSGGKGAFSGEGGFQEEDDFIGWWGKFSQEEKESFQDEREVLQGKGAFFKEGRWKLFFLQIQ